MAFINIKPIYAVAKKEFMDNLRNKWIIAMLIIFLLLTILASYLAGGQSGGESALGGMEETVVSLLSISSLLIPIIAIMLGYLDMSMFPASGLLAYAQRDRPDPLGAIVIVEKLNELLNISVDTEELSNNAQAIEEEIKKQLAPIEENQTEDLSSKRIYT